MTQETPINPIPKDRSPTTVALDNLVRRKLRVSDPNNPTEIATALKSLYSGEKEVLEQEAAGLPYIKVKTIRTESGGATTTRTETTQALQDVDRDLEALVGNASLKDIQAELRGWAHAIRRISSGAVEAARFALDSRQRDSAMAARRQLGAYARLARYVGAMTPDLNLPYRQLAKSLDEVSAMILVTLGDALANSGPGGARFILQAPASELQSRRDAVIYALRNLIGTTAEGYGPNEWPRGLVAYRQFVERLERSGHADLRSLFQENYVANALDELVHWANSGASDDLRALASTSDLALERFRRLIILASRLIDPESPPLAAYVSAIQLFLDGFEHGESGSRLLYIARPPIVFYGLYGMSGMDEAGTRRLVDIIIARGHLAEQLDCYLGCSCGADQVRCQIILDKILYDVDRAIDLYALGTTSEGEPEQRAAAYGVLIDLLLASPSSEYVGLGHERRVICQDQDQGQGHRPVCATLRLNCLDSFPEIRTRLEEIRDYLWWETRGIAGAAPRRFDLNGFNVGVNQAVAGFTNQPFDDLGAAVGQVLTNIRVHNQAPLEQLNIQPGDVHQTLHEHVARLANMHQELCIQQALDEQWVNLLRAMAPSCIRFNGDELLASRSLLSAAIASVQLENACTRYTPDIPPHFETSLAGIPYLRPSQGGS